MAGIITNVDSDVQKLRKLKNEIEEVKKALKGINIKVDVDIAKGMEAQLKSLTDQYNALVMKVAEAEGKILLSTKRINDASEKIIQAQEKVSKAAGIPTNTGNTNSQGVNAAETASIQSQAKAYQDLKAEINGILGTREANIKRMVDEMNAIRLINVEIKKITKSQGESSSLSSAQQKRLEQLNNSLLTHKTALSEVRQTLSNNVKLDNVASTSMNGLSQSLSRMRIAYRELTEEERKSPIGKELLASINQADAKIKELDASIGNHQRKVGDYASGFNGLGMSVQQIVRELPAAKMGINMFFLAISNNIPIMVDEIKRATAANELLKKSGQTSVPVWKQVASSLLSWQTGMMVGITLLTMYGKDIVNWVGSLFNANEVLKETKRFQDALNQSMRDANKDIIDETTKLKILYRAATDAKKSIEERTIAVRELKKEFPSYFGLMDDEEIKAGKAADAYKLLTDRIIASVKARRTEKLIVSEQNKYLDYLGETTNAYMRLQEAQERANKANIALEESATDYNVQEYKDAFNDLRKTQDEYDKARAKSQKQAENVYNLITTTNASKLYGSQKERDKATIENKDFWTEQKNIAEKALNDIASKQKKLMDAGKFEGVPSDVIEQYKKAIKLRDEADKALKIYESKDKQENQSEKLRKEQDKFNVLLNKQALEQQRSAEDMQMKVDEAQIKAMDEGSAKTIAEMELNFEKEMQAIDRQKEDTLRKKIEDARATWETSPDKKKGETFNASGITLSISENDVFDNLYKSGIASFEKNLKEYQNKQDNAWNEYYIKYGEYQEKRKAIMDKYDKQIADAEEGSVEKSTFIAQRKEDLDSLDDELMKNSELWGRFFTDFSNRSSSSIRNIIEDIQELIDYMNGIEGTKIPDLFKDNEKTVKAINDAMANPSSLNKFTSSLSSQIAKFKKMLDKDNPFKMIQDGFKNNDYESTSKGFGSIASAVKELDGVLGDLGVKSESTAGKVTSVLSSTASYAATGASIGGPWGAVIGGAIGMASGLIGVLGADYSAYNKMKDEYASLIDVWDILINKKKEYVNISYGDEARKAGEEAIDILNKKSQAKIDLGIERLNSGASAGSHSIGVRIRKSMTQNEWNQWDEFARSIGMDPDAIGGRLTGLFSLTGKQLSKLQEEAPTFWAKLDDDVKGYLQDIIDCNEEIENMKEQLKETMTGVSFDSFYDNFVSTLSDMDKDSQDFADDFENYLKNAILSNLVANKYRSKIEALYNDWANKSDSNGDGIFDLTSSEADELRKAQQALAEEMIAERDAMAEVFGWTSSASSQESSKKGFATMSQDSADELNGRFTALQIAGEEIKNQNQLQTMSILELKAGMLTISANSSGIKDIADDTRDLIAQSYLELVQISENTGNSAKYLKDIKADIAEVKKNTSKL